MNNSIQTTLDELTTIFNTTDEVLSEWNQPTNLHFPVLMGMIAVKLNWDDKQLREADPIVRFYVRKHPDWYVTRGAHGGIMRVADKQKKEDARLAKSTIKEQLKAAIEAKVTQVPVPTMSDNLVSGPNLQITNV